MAETNSYLRFPIDLGSQTQGHFMKITIYPSQAMLSSSRGQDSIKIAMFIPGGGQNGAMQWQMVHEYDDVKLARLGMNMIGAVTSAPAMAAGAARIAGQGTINPKVDVLYSNSQLRQFQFDFFMAPSSAEEQRQMNGIIKTLRKYSAPEIVGAPSSIGDVAALAEQYLPEGLAAQLKTGLWFVPPAEFDIEFKHISNDYAQTNKYLPKIARSVLMRVDVNYTQQGEFSTFKDGSPTSAQLTLVFKEMRVISQADVDAGY
jgi:hypothetical protein